MTIESSNVPRLPCVILAGGLGTRMQPLTERLPKALVPVLDRPFVDWQLQWLRAAGVREVIFSIGYRGEQIQDHVGDGSRFGVRARYVDEGTALRGTGGALRLALDRGLLPDAFFVLYGDSYLSLDLAEVERVWHGSGRPALMTVFPNRDQWVKSNAILHGDQVAVYDKRDPERHGAHMRWIDYGLSILIEETVRQRVPASTVADLADLLAGLAKEGKLAGYEAKARFYEVGSPAGLTALEKHLRAQAGESPGLAGAQP